MRCGLNSYAYLVNTKINNTKNPIQNKLNFNFFSLISTQLIKMLFF